MRLGGPILEKTSDPEAWARAVTRLGYRAAYCPMGADSSDDVVREYAAAAEAADLVIAEVGAWSNTISPDDTIRRAAIHKCTQQLALADRIGALCCVNIAGSRGEQWDGPYPDNLSEDTFALIVDTVREIIDAVKPIRTFYTLETMPWVFPDSPDSYVRLIAAIGRDRFAVHLDPANMISSPRLLFDNSAFIRDCFAKLGPHIRSCHAKDIRLGGNMTVHLDEVAPGLGALDYRTLLREIDALDRDVPMMLEHLTTAEEYSAAADHVRSVARQEGIRL